MNKDELLKLRKQLVDKTRQTALSGADGPAESMAILMGLIRSGDTSSDIMNKAAMLAEQLPEEDRVDAYLDLIYEIDAQLGDSNEESTA